MTLLGQNVNSYGHDLRARGALRARRRRALGGSPARPGGPAGPRRAHPRDRWPADRRRPTGHRPRLRFVTSHPWDLSDRLIAALAECDVGLRAPPPARPVGLRRGAPADGPPVHDRALPRAPRRASARRSRTSRSRPTSSSGSAARPRPSSRRRCALLETVRYDQVFAAAYSPRPGTPAHAPRRRRAGRRQAPPAQRAARASRRRSGSSATRRGSGARSRSSSTRSSRRAHGHDATTPADAGTASVAEAARAVVRPDARQQARPPRRRRGARRARGPRPDRPRRPVRAARRARRRVTEDRARRSSSSPAPRRPARPSSRSGSPRRSARAAGRWRSSRPIRARSSAASTSARPRSAPADRARVAHHGLDLVDPDQPFSVADFATHARGVLAGIGRDGGRRDPGRRHRALPARGRRAASTPTRCRAIPTSAPGSRRS